MITWQTPFNLRKNFELTYLEKYTKCETQKDINDVFSNFHSTHFSFN